MQKTPVREWEQSTVEFNHKLFKGAFSMIVVGKRNSGKTSLVLDMLIDPGFLDYDSLYIFSPSIYQQKYQLIIKGFQAGLTKEEVDNIFKLQHEINEKRSELNKPKITDPEEFIDIFTNHEDFEPTENPIEVQAFKSIDDVPKVEDVDKSKKNVFIFDDCATKKKTIIDTYYSRGRHSNIICIYLTQRYHELPLMIRDNTDIVIIFPLNNQKPLQYFYNDYCSLDFETLKEFKKYCQECWKDDYSFAIIDTRNRNPNERYKKNFDIPFSQIDK
jgi:hypothetical protein